MTSIMYKAINMDENGDARRKEDEIYQRLLVENKVGFDFLRMGFDKVD